MRYGLAFVSWMFMVSICGAEIQTKSVEYKDGDVTLEGFVAWNDALKKDAPGILVVHQWMGLSDNEKNRCRQLAELVRLRGVRGGYLWKRHSACESPRSR